MFDDPDYRSVLGRVDRFRALALLAFQARPLDSFLGVIDPIGKIATTAVADSTGFHS